MAYAAGVAITTAVSEVARAVARELNSWWKNNQRPLSSVVETTTWKWCRETWSGMGSSRASGAADGLRARETTHSTG